MTESRLLWVATIISIATYQLWVFLPKGSFYVGNALCYFLFALVIYRQNRELFVSFLLLCLTINNLFDELFFDPTKNGLNEAIFSVLTIVFYYARKIYSKRTLHISNKDYISSFFGGWGKNSNRNEKK